MSAKRSRAAYEADLQAQQSPYVLFGTALPPQDPQVRDDGSFVPVWKQEVRDDRGRKRLHGAFTGGWSAGYYNTVGSKEGWSPSTFVSSRENRRKDDTTDTSNQRPEDFMDEEDLADAAEAQKLQTTDSFAALGSSNAHPQTVLSGLFRIGGDTAGIKLLKKMGWKEGQGLGPKVRRAARLDLKSAAGDKSHTHLFAPEDVPMVQFTRKIDHKGIGYGGETPLAAKPLPVTRAGEESDGQDEDEDDAGGIFGRPRLPKSKSKPKKRVRGGIGIGVLKDTGSDDEDPYEIGPRISYNKVIGGDKKKKAKGAGLGSSGANPSVQTKPVFVSRKNAAVRSMRGFRKCHDGQLPLTGFIFGVETDPLITAISSEGKYPGPTIPPDWKSVKVPQSKGAESSQAYKSTAEVAKYSKHDPTSRAALLGESQLPGKSVFDFLSASSRNRLAVASGKGNLPPGLGEVPAEHALSEEAKHQQLFSKIPKLEKETAVAAMTRGAGPGAPYVDNEEKRVRYRKYLEHSAGYIPEVPTRPGGMKEEEWLHELFEFYGCARIFKPMAGVMASRFTTSSSASSKAWADGASSESERDLVARPAAKRVDPAEEAAEMGMYGSLTRTVEDFYPTRLLCKRFGVRPPDNVQPEPNQKPRLPVRTEMSPYYGQPASQMSTSEHAEHGGLPARGPLSQVLEQPVQQETAGAVEREPGPVVVDAERNEALEGNRPAEEVFKAIFGDSDEEDGDE